MKYMILKGISLRKMSVTGKGAYSAKQISNF